MLEDFGPYRIVRRIAVGGMAEIYLARHRGIEGLERTVVVKRILPTLGHSDEFVTMFLDEARLLAGLSHPNIAQVFDIGRVEDTYYLVMEYVRGPTLGALLSAAARAGQRTLPPKVALGVALGVAEALSYAHARRDELGRPLGVVHRDLNPANVIVSYDGAIKLIDFGIAKAASRVYATRSGVIKGTHGYIAPEQLTGRGIPVDHRADVFALGILLYEMLIGKHPFDLSDEPDLLERILGARYKRPRQVAPEFPETLDRLIARCLSPHPEGRPDQMRNVIDGIAEYLSESRSVVTMGDIATLTHQLVPDTEGATPLRPLTQSQRPLPPLEPARTQKLVVAPAAEEEEATVHAPVREGTIPIPRAPRASPAPPPAALAVLAREEAADLSLASMLEGEEPVATSRGPRPPSTGDFPASDTGTTLTASPAPKTPPRTLSTADTTPAIPKLPNVTPLRSRIVASLAHPAVRLALSAAFLLVVGVGAFYMTRAIGLRLREDDAAHAAGATARVDVGIADDEAEDEEGADIEADDPGPGPSPSAATTVDKTFARAHDAGRRSLAITSEPIGAIVIVSGRADAISTPATIEVSTGIATQLRLEAPGYAPTERVVDAQTRSVHVALERLPSASVVSAARAEDAPPSAADDAPSAAPAAREPPRPVRTTRRRRPRRR